MVGFVTRRVVIYSFLLGAGIYVLWPDMVVEVSYPYSRALPKAIATYRAENGQFARSLVDVEPYLEQQTNTDCLITARGGDEYTVEMPLGDGKTYYMDVRYVVNSDGEWENFDGRITDIRRTR